MLELERLGVRVVSGRLGRKAGEEEEGEKKSAGTLVDHVSELNCDNIVSPSLKLFSQKWPGHLRWTEPTAWAGQLTRISTA